MFSFLPAVSELSRDATVGGASNATVTYKPSLSAASITPAKYLHNGSRRHKHLLCSLDARIIAEAKSLMAWS